jgi:hypothetical protein
LTIWPNPFDLPVFNLTDINDIFKAKLEILSADIKEELIVVACSQHNAAFDYCGENLEKCTHQKDRRREWHQRNL